VTAADGAAAVTALRSPRRLAFMRAAFLRTFKADFHAMRRSHGGAAPADAPHLVLYANHPAWWDPVTLLLATELLFPGRPVYAPMEAAMLARYPVFRRLGIFPVETGSRAGARQFLAGAMQVLRDPRNILVVTAQGRFADVRERPLRLQPGIAHLAARASLSATLQPLALEYAFWTERQPEALLRLGPPIATAHFAGQGPAACLAQLEQALGSVMDELAADAIARDPGRFDVLLRGRVGIGGLYDVWRAALARLAGRRFSAAHGDGR
jgi:1-acyl-sn-glycerol-3-phosphate acyltransferase